MPFVTGREKKLILMLLELYFRDFHRMMESSKATPREDNKVYDYEAKSFEAVLTEMVSERDRVEISRFQLFLFGF